MHISTLSAYWNKFIVLTLIFSITYSSCLNAMMGGLEDDIESGFSIGRGLLYGSEDIELSGGQPTIRRQAAGAAMEDPLLEDMDDSIERHFVAAFKEDLSEELSRFSNIKSIVSILTGIIVCIPQVSISLEVGKHYNSQAYGIFLISTLFLSDGSIIAWLTNELIEDAQELYHRASRIRRSSGCCSLEFFNEIKLGVISLVLGALSTVPEVYKSYKYNSVKWLAAISFLYGFVAKPLGFYKFFSNFSLKPKCCQESPEKAVKAKASDLIDQSRRYFLQKCKENGANQLKLSLQDIEGSAEIVALLFPEGGHMHDDTARSKLVPLCKAILLPAAALFPLASATFEAVMASKGYEEMISSPAANYTLTAFSVLPSFFIGVYVIGSASTNFIDKIQSMKRRLPSSDYFRVLHPKTYFVIGGIAIALSISNSLGGYFIVTDNLKGTFIEPIMEVVAGLSIVSGLVFGSYTISHTLKNNVSLALSKCSQPASFALRTLKNLSSVTGRLATSTYSVVTSFIHTFRGQASESDREGSDMLLSDSS